MLINKYEGEKEHPGYQPVRVLWKYTTAYFQDYHPSIINDHEELKNKGHLTANINVDINKLPLITSDGNQLPYIKNGTIHITETFLMYLWCVCSMHVPLYEIVHKKNFPENNPYPFSECYDLMKFASELKTKYSVLSKDKLNPEMYDKKNEKIIDIINGTFIHAINFIFCHEYAHAKYRLYGGTKKDEESADFEAVKMLREGAKNRDDLGNRSVGAIIGLGSLLLLSEKVYTEKHPDNDIRLLSLFENLSINDDNSELWGLGCLIFAYWDNEFAMKLDYMAENSTVSYKERFTNLVRQ
jgi:hypothetical protein